MRINFKFLGLFQRSRQLRYWILFTLIWSLAGCRQIVILKEIPDAAAVIATDTPNAHIDFEAKLQDLESTMSKPHTNTFKVPYPADQQTFQALIQAVQQRNLLQASQLADIVNYKVLDLMDSGSADSESYVLQEVAPPGRGWGIYFFRAQTARDIVLEAPHPITDENTVNVALHLYRGLNARALLVAGARRDTNNDDSADVAHAPESIFQTVHQTLFTLNDQPNTNIVFLQIHGYASEDHANLPEVVIGYNWQNDPTKDELLAKIVKSMKANQLTVGTCYDRTYSGVCGTTNIQRQVTPGGIFLHLELSPALRAHDAALIKALQIALGQ